MTGPRKAPRTTTLATAVEALVAVAARANLDEAQARAEGEGFAAVVADVNVGAFVDWNRETGRAEAGAQAFKDAASRGRRWRVGPTPLLQQLVLGGSEHARAYAEGLGAVAAAACLLGTPDPRVAGNAVLAASAQLGATVPGHPGGAPDARHSGHPGTPRELVGWPMTFDLGDLDPAEPGAFANLGPSASPGIHTPARAPDGFRASDEPQATATTPDEPEAKPETPAPEPKSLAELLAELDALIGLADVKAEIHRQVAVLRVEKLRAGAGLKSPTITRHLVFVGNPGTGKTTVARLVGGIYRALGLLSKGQLVEVDRSELVAGYLGQTAMKTAEVVASAAGGVLFIDEAYSLAGDQYGTEAVDTLVKEMEDRRDDLVLIVAGYPGPMALFIAQNPGLASRFRTTIEFADYSDEELVQIFTSLAATADYDVGEDVVARFRAILATTPRGPLFGNGRLARNTLEGAIGRHAWRLRDVAEPTLQQLRALQPDDLDPAESRGSAQADDLGQTESRASGQPDAGDVTQPNASARPDTGDTTGAAS